MSKLNLNSIMIGSTQPKVLAEFYGKVFDKPADMNEGEWRGWSVGNTFFSVGQHSEAKGKSKEGPRIMFNLETTEVQEEFDRIKAIKGAEVVKEPYEMGGAWIATLSDPDGNYFQLMTPWDNMDNKN
jgi:predicted enzyme related to lactoylglutathione lyase